ncbi:hypothetical protein [Nicoliella lavandulae]|uniref:YokE-like PH domain-containing protein n=1 Tax=Nicoliella lavandulae TaxID=3082954 RepID=A0ABU8SLN9_9LACO
MKRKQCPECGTMLAPTDLACPNCGFSFSGVEAPATGATTKFNLNAKLPDILLNSLNEDIKADQITYYKRLMGFSDRSDNIVFAQSYNKKQSLALIWDLLVAKSYILSFEKNGILFIGIGKSGQFTGENAYLTDLEIREFDFRYGIGKRVITIRSTKGLIKLSCPSTIKMNTFQKKNLSNLGELTDSYNTWIDQQ